MKLTKAAVISYVLIIESEKKYCGMCGAVENYRLSVPIQNWSKSSTCSACKKDNKKRSDNMRYCRYCGVLHETKNLSKPECPECVSARKERKEYYLYFFGKHPYIFEKVKNMICRFLDNEFTLNYTKAQLNKCLNDRFRCRVCMGKKSEDYFDNIVSESNICRECASTFCEKHKENKNNGVCVSCRRETIEQDIKDEYSSQVDELLSEISSLNLRLENIQAKIAKRISQINVLCEDCGCFLTDHTQKLCPSCLEKKKECYLSGIYKCKKCGKRNDRLNEKVSAETIVFSDVRKTAFFPKICSACLKIEEGMKEQSQTRKDSRTTFWDHNNYQKDPGFYSKMK